MIDVKQEPKQEIEIIQIKCDQGIDISACPANIGLKIAIDAKVPKALSILPQTTFDTPFERENSRMYVDANGTPSFATLEQIKQLNTKTICVDDLSDERINALSDEDIVLLRKR